MKNQFLDEENKGEDQKEELNKALKWFENKYKREEEKEHNEVKHANQNP